VESPRSSYARNVLRYSYFRNAGARPVLRPSRLSSPTGHRVRPLRYAIDDIRMFEIDSRRVEAWPNGRICSYGNRGSLRRAADAEPFVGFAQDFRSIGIEAPLMLAAICAQSAGFCAYRHEVR
jgi:hypothetical protein